MAQSYTLHLPPPILPPTIWRFPDFPRSRLCIDTSFPWKARKTGHIQLRWRNRVSCNHATVGSLFCCWDYGYFSGAEFYDLGFCFSAVFSICIYFYDFLLTRFVFLVQKRWYNKGIPCRLVQNRDMTLVQTLQIHRIVVGLGMWCLGAALTYNMCFFGRILLEGDTRARKKPRKRATIWGW